ncbi:hypothetical protein JCM10212_004702 [Sporobolomyces blumeae]
MTADWMNDSNGTAHWQEPHRRSFYRESIHPASSSSAAAAAPSRDPNSNVAYPNSFTGTSVDLEEKHRRLQDSLDKVLGPEYVATRPGGGGAKLTYLEGWKAINLANEVFGFNGWFTDIKYLEVDFIDYSPESQRYSMGVTAIVRVRLQDGASHEDVGYGKLENTKSKADGLDKCKKEAVTDALKRALRHFGKLLGNCLYDKHYLSQLSAMKAKKPKFEWDSLYKPEHHSLYAEDPRPLPRPRSAPGLDPTSMPPPPVPEGAKPVGSTSTAVPAPPKHPAHMTGGVQQRAQTVGGKANAGQGSNAASNTRNSYGQQPSTTHSTPNAKPVLPPQLQRSMTVSHPSRTGATANANANAPDPLDRSGARSTATEYSMFAGDESILAGIDLADVSGSTSERGDLTSLVPPEGAESGTGRVWMEGDDSGFAEASTLQSIKESPHSTARLAPEPQPRQPPPPHPVRQTTSSSPTETSTSVSKATGLQQAEANKLAALARLESNRKAKEAAAARGGHVSATVGGQGPVGTGGAGAGDVGSTGAAQGPKGQHQQQATIGGRVSTSTPTKPPTTMTSRQVSPPNGVGVAQVAARQAGTLPTLNVGNGIVQAQGHGVGQGLTGDAAGTGFVSARGVKRAFGEGPEPPALNHAPLARAHTVSNPMQASTTRRPLEELDVGDQGEVKRFRASS